MVVLLNAMPEEQFALFGVMFHVDLSLFSPSAPQFRFIVAVFFVLVISLHKARIKSSGNNSIVLELFYYLS
jgi:hypothetical protein